jgi:hypothetical protein
MRRRPCKAGDDGSNLAKPDDQFRHQDGGQHGPDRNSRDPNDGSADELAFHGINAPIDRFDSDTV